MRALVLAFTLASLTAGCTLVTAPSLHDTRPPAPSDRVSPVPSEAAIHGLRAGDEASVATRDGKRYVGSVTAVSETELTLDLNGRQKILLWETVAEANRIDTGTPRTPAWLSPRGTGGTIQGSN